VTDTPPPQDDPFASEDLLEEPSDEGTPLVEAGASPIHPAARDHPFAPGPDEDASHEPGSSETALVLVQSASDRLDPVPSASDRMEEVASASHFDPVPTTSDRLDPVQVSSERLATAPAAAVAAAYAGAPGRKAMIQLKELHKSFGSRHILRGVNLEVLEGETICIIGGSGTGKSVSLKHIMRLLDPDSGEVWLDGQEITHVTGDALEVARSKLGVNFQFGALLNWLTVFENVALPLQETTDMGAEEIERRVMAKLELLNIPHARDHYPTQISGGMVKRAGLARAVVKEESLKVILYDEPTSGLDPISTALVDEMVNEMKARLGLTQVIVTHDMESAYRTADRIAVLFEGKVIFYDTPEAIRASKIPYVKQFVAGLSKPPSEF
jgi:phospholipid/cholesterol/gamma-HCH transport system ATP-binding protein